MTERTMKHFLSLGAGVQSSALALMAKHGVVTPMFDAAIFADTQWEPKAVYTWLDWLEKQLPFPVYRVTHGDLWKSASTIRRTKDGQRTYVQTGIPIFVASADGQDGLTIRKGIGKRQCTRDFKVTPFRRKAKELLGLKRASKNTPVLAVVSRGISADEAARASTSEVRWLENRHPLLEMDFDRLDCLKWMEDNGYPKPPRSACIFCPFHDDNEWLALDRDELATVTAMENQLQTVYAATSEFKGTPYFHDSLKPLRQVTFVPQPKTTTRQRRMFGADCKGFCKT